MKRFPRLAPRDWIGLGLVLAGFVLRLRQYFSGRSLWLDEAMLANNILGRDFAGLFRPLDNHQGAPVGFLLLQKSVTLLLGDSEYALRLVPLLAGLLALALMFLLTRNISRAFAGSLALALFAFSPALIYYASEVKQYSSDVALALGLLLLYRKCENARLNIRDAARLALGGALAVWFSHPALFVAAALGLALFLPAYRAKDKRALLALLLVAAVWSVNLGVLYFVNLRPLSTHPFFLDFWREGFLPHDASAFGWLGRSLEALFVTLLGLRTACVFTAFLLLIGLAGLSGRLPRFGFFLGLVFLLSLLASFLTLYPFAGRMILFLVPALTLLLAEGAESVSGLAGFPRTVRSLLRLALTAYLLFGPLTLAVENFTAPKYQEHLRPAMEYLRDHRRDGDRVYVYHWAEHAVRFYAPKYGMDLSAFTFGADHHTQPELYLPELDALRGNARVWFLFSHVYEEGGFNERDYMLNYLDSIGDRVKEYRLPGTSVYLYLYDLRE